MNIDFKQIKSHSGDQKAAFEELICQLAHLEKFDNRIDFRRSGRGADGGVECYWITDSGTEICWQAKYFIDHLSNNEWRQIDKSVNSAIKNHPKMSEYIICIPLNRTDSRQKDRDGSLKQTEMAKWDSKVQKWTSLATKSGLKVDFIYWGETEILNKLLINNAANQGIRNYFFGLHSLNMDILKEIVKGSKLSLGERYSENDNIRLTISDNFDALSNSESWKRKVKENLSLVTIIPFSNREIEAYSVLNLFNEHIRSVSLMIKRFHHELPTHFAANQLNEACTLLYRQIIDFLEIGSFDEKIYDLQQQDQENRRKNKKGIDVKNISDELKFLEQIKNKANQSWQTLSKISGFLEDIEFRSYLHRIVILEGEAGIGKSHLLCDVALNNLANKIPTVFLLGQHYAGGNPLEFLKKALGLDRYADSEILDMLNVMAKSLRSRFVIIIDAINEGAGRQQWYNYLIEFIAQIKKYPHLSLILSCRTTYKKLIIPQNILDDKEIIITRHTGFLSLEEKAVEKYFSRRNIMLPSSPILKPEFSNPLFLKTCCDALDRKGLHTFPKGNGGFVSLFEFYLSSINEKISIRIGTRPSKNIIFAYVDKFIDILFPDNFYVGVKIAEAEALESQICHNHKLLDLLIDEGLLSLDVYSDSKGRQEEVVRFTFERYGEHIVARQIVTQCDTKANIAELFSCKGTLSSILSLEKRYEYQGLISALALYIAEIFHCELIELIDKKIIAENEIFFIQSTFCDTVLWRSSKGICDKSFELLNKMGRKAIKILIELSIEPDHPLNVLYLESKLMGMSIVERDWAWSTYIAEEPEWDGASSSVQKVLTWAQISKFDMIEIERLELLASLMLWFTSTSNRYVRDAATKVLSKIFFYCSHIIVPFIKKHININDMYIIERLYAAIFGAVVYLHEKNTVQSIANEVYAIQFKNQSPTINIMIREYASLIIEYANSQGILSSDIVLDACRPPFNSIWSYNIPTKEELDSKEEIYGLWNSLYGLGDFKKYSMRCVEDWSNTPIYANEFITGSTLQEQFHSTLTGQAQKLYQEYISLEKQKAILHDEAIEQGLSLLDILLNNYKKGGSALCDEYTQKEKKLDEKKEVIKSTLHSIFSDESKQTFEEIDRMHSERPVKFNIDIAVRFVHNKVLELGWTNKNFKRFDSNYAYDAVGRNNKRIERIGKKYQWIALYELLAKLSDNFKWINREYDDLKDEVYYGTMQISIRNIDPTMWLNKTESTHDYYREQTSAWWELPAFTFSLSLGISPNEWLEDKSILPNFAEMLNIVHDGEWTVLRGYSDYNQNVDEECSGAKREEIWYRINSAIIPKKKRKVLSQKLSQEKLESPEVFAPPSFTSEIFYGEFHWQPYFQRLDITKSKNMWKQEGYDFDIHIPTSEYSWEQNADDNSLVESINVYLPSPVLIRELNLNNTPRRYGFWLNSNDEVVFQDPSIIERGNGYALVNTTYLYKWLDAHDLEIIWFVGGEKQLHHPKEQSDNFGVNACYTFNFAFAKDAGEVKQIHFKDEALF